MSLRRIFCSFLASVAICCVLFSVSAYAVGVEQYSYNGVILPPIVPHSKYPETTIILSDGLYFLCYSNGTYKASASGSINFGTSNMKIVDGGWQRLYFDVEGIPIWSSYDIYYKDTGELFLAASDPVVTWVERPVVYSDFKPVVVAFGDQINVRLVIGVLTGLAGVSVGMVFMWWGVRKVSGSLMKAFKKGKIRI